MENNRFKKKSLHIWLAFIFTALLLLALFLVAVNVGSLSVSASQLVKGLFVSYDPTVARIYDLRFPRIFISMMAGAALSVPGLLIQSVMKNPVAEPGIIGISSGASFVSVIILAFFPSLYFLSPLFAFAGGILSFLIIYSLSWKSGFQPLRLILVGIAINAVFTGLIDAFSSMSTSKYSSVASSVSANVTMKTWSDVKMLAGYILIGFILSFLLAGRCNLLALEEKTIRSLGIHVNALRLVVSAVAVLLASITTAVIGTVSFLGLIVPHIARRLVGSNHKILIPYCMLLGALLFLLADTLGRSIAAPYEIPASIFMSVIGGPFLILLLRHDNSRVKEN